MGEERHQHEHRHARSDDLTGVLAPEETAMSRRRPFLHMPVPWVFVAAYLLGVGVQLLVPVHVNSPAASLAIRIAGASCFLPAQALRLGAYCCSARQQLPRCLARPRKSW